MCFSFFLPQPLLTSPFFCFSFSVSLLLLSFFLPSCLSFLLSFCFLFLSLFHVSFFSAFVFWKAQHESFKLQFVFFINIFSFYGFQSCLSNPFFLIFVIFLILSYVFCSTWMFLVSKQTTKKNTHFFGEKGGCNKTFFLSTCVLQNVKSSRFLLPLFCPMLVDVQTTL